MSLKHFVEIEKLWNLSVMDGSESIKLFSIHFSLQCSFISKPVKTIVTQGSVLGRLLFFIHINGLQKTMSNVRRLFADITAVVAFADSRTKS